LDVFLAWCEALFYSHPGKMLLLVFAFALCKMLAVTAFFTPPAASLVLVGAIVQRQEVHHYLFIGSVTLGSLLGSQMNFYLGKRYRRRGTKCDLLKPSSPMLMFLCGNGSPILRGGILLLYRFLGPLRVGFPLLAGVGAMRWRHFLIFDVISATLWGWALLKFGSLFL
jgi:membrane-associated protein